MRCGASLYRSWRPPVKKAPLVGMGHCLLLYEPELVSGRERASRLIEDGSRKGCVTRSRLRSSSRCLLNEPVLKLRPCQRASYPRRNPFRLGPFLRAFGASQPARLLHIPQTPSIPTLGKIRKSPAMAPGSILFQYRAGEMHLRSTLLIVTRQLRLRVSFTMCRTNRARNLLGLAFCYGNLCN
jgi:hypothetical protein